MEAIHAEDVHGQDQQIMEEACGPAPLTVLQASTAQQHQMIAYP
jgi:hypothetical protein